MQVQVRVQVQARGPELQTGVHRESPVPRPAGDGRFCRILRRSSPEAGVSSAPSSPALLFQASFRVPDARVSQVAVQGAWAVKGALLLRTLAPRPVLPGSGPARNQKVKREHHCHFLENIDTPELHGCSGSPRGNFWGTAGQRRGPRDSVFLLSLPLHAV